MGIDEVRGAAPGSPASFESRSDTMLLVRFDPTSGSVSALQLPRDTQVGIPGYGVEKLNAGNVLGGPALAADLVSRLLGGVPVDRYVRIDTRAFRELVDAVGGVEVTVPKPMDYDDNTQKLHIHLAAGPQTLTGAQSEQFVRFRHDELGDIGRVQRQQMLLRALREKLTSPLMIARLPQLVLVVQQYVNTNLGPDEVLSLLGVALQDQGKVRMAMLPGRPGMQNDVSYWLLDEQARDRLVADFFQGGSTGFSDRLPPQDLQIAVQNGAGVNGVAGRVARQLLAQGFRNAYVSEAWNLPLDQTEIIARKGDTDAAETIRQQLGLGKVVAIADGDLGSDITIRLGRDWAATHP